MEEMKEAIWDVSGSVPWDCFSSGDKLTFIVAKHDNTNLRNGFKFEVSGLIDGEGKFHILGYETKVSKE